MLGDGTGTTTVLDINGMDSIVVEYLHAGVSRDGVFAVKTCVVELDLQA